MLIIIVQAFIVPVEPLFVQATLSVPLIVHSLQLAFQTILHKLQILNSQNQESTIYNACVSVFWLNVVPPSPGVSKMLTPHELMLDNKLDFKNHACLYFGQYVQVKNATTNDMAPRTTGGIALRPTGYSRGTWLFYSLEIGKLIHRNIWTPLPVDQVIIDRIHALADYDGLSADSMSSVDELGFEMWDDGQSVDILDANDGDEGCGGELEGPSDGNHFYGSPDGDIDESTEVENTQDVDIDITSEIAHTQDVDVNSIQPTGVDDRSFNQRWSERHGVNRYNLRSQREPSYTRYGRAAVHLAKLHEAEVQLNTVFVGDVRAEPLLAHNYLTNGCSGSYTEIW